MTDTEKAEIYRKGIVCQECIRYEQCASETPNTGLKRIFGNECRKDMKAVIESGELDRLIMGVRHSIDNGMDVSDADLKIYNGYVRTFER